MHALHRRRPRGGARRPPGSTRADARFIDDLAADEWTYGVSQTYLRELCDYWRTTFDWRAQEAILNGFDQLETHVDGQHLHLIHARSPNPDAMPLLLVHGWPGSIFEFVKVIGPLADPAAHGGDPSDAFHVVAPSLPGYGFSGPTTEPGWGPGRIAAAFAQLMERLGYGRYGAAGGDWGAIITTELARADGGRHLSAACTSPCRSASRRRIRESEHLSEADQRGLEDWAAHQAAGTVVHVAVNSTRPHTLAFALNDSPAGLAAWLVDKFRSYSDCDGDLERSFTKDELLAEITTYWVTGTIASASRLYYERAHERSLAPSSASASTSRPGAPSSPETSAGSRGRGPSVVTTCGAGRRCRRAGTSRAWRSPSSWWASSAPSSDPFGDVLVSA